MANLLELAEENRFRIRAYTNAAQSLSELTEDVEELLKAGTLTEIPGIGKGIAEKIRDYCTTGKIGEYEKLKTKFPEGLLEMLSLSGLGPKRCRLLYQKMGIDSIEKLKKAASQGKLRELEGFGAKIEENILKGIAFKDESNRRILLWEAMQLAENMTRQMQQSCRSIEKFVACGSLRRWKETVGDLDFLCVSKKPEEVMGAFVHQKEVKQILAQGKTKASVVHANGLQCDLRVVPVESFGAALLYFTGSKEHNVALREFALKKGFTINEYGLYTLNKKKAVAGKTEEEIYQKLGLEFIPPELRENRGEIAAAAKKSLPTLVSEKDVQGDFHNHTNLTDGANSLEEMAAKAKEKGWEWFVSADHSQSLKVTKGLDRTALLKKKKEIEKLNSRWKNFQVLLGSEVDILSNGEMDYDEKTLSEIDFVVASVHTGFSQSEEQITSRILSAMKNPYVHIIGHLTGRLLHRREPYAVNLAQVLQEAKKTGTALEINGQPERLDIYDIPAKKAGEMGIKIALDTDAHSVNQLEYMKLAVATARRAWLTKEQILNCMSYPQLMEWKAAKLERAG